MTYLLKKRIIRGGESNGATLEVYAAEGGLLFTQPLADYKGIGYFVHTEFSLSPDERFLMIKTGSHCMGEHDYTFAVHVAATGALFYTAYDMPPTFSADGGVLYVLRDPWGNTTIIVDAQTGAVIETRADQGALYRTGMCGEPLSVVEYTES